MRPWKCIAGVAGVSLLLAAGFRTFPSFAALWHARVARPFAALAASLSERLPFPLLEPLGFALILCAAAGFFRGWKKGLTRLTAIVSILLTVYVLAWLPGYFVPMEQVLAMEIAKETQDTATAPDDFLPPSALYSAEGVSRAETLRAHNPTSASAEQPRNEATVSAETSSQASPTSNGAEAQSEHNAPNMSTKQPLGKANASSEGVPMSSDAAIRSSSGTTNAHAEQPLDESTVSAPSGTASSNARLGESSSELEELCLRLIDELNASKLRFTGGKSALLQAMEAMNAAFGAELGENAVRFARYPEWMAALDLAGFYSPWTGEALVSPNLSAAALPFTACHELAHRLGVADEGAANIAAWIACRQSGGEPADSAALWALRYAMAELRASDEAAWRRCAQEMRPALVRTFAPMNSFSEASDTARSQFLLRGADSYAVLIPWLIEHSEAWE